jgi:hypothetical protein
MDTHTPTARASVFEDSFGRRHHAVLAGGEPFEVLELRGEFSSAAF